MSQANEILDNLTGEEIAALAANSQIEPHIVISRDRFISVPESLRRVAVQFDKDIETVTFDCPRYWDGHDFSKMKIFINYMRADGTPGSFIAENIVIDATDDTMIHFDWTVSEHAALVKGQLSFLVCINIAKPDGTKERGWHSELNKEMFISEGLECTEAIINSYPDVVTQILVVSDRANAIAETLEKNLREGKFELGLPIVDEDDNGKILRVEDGQWRKDEVHVFEGGVVHEMNNSVFIRYSANADGSDFTETCQKGQYYVGIATALAAPVHAADYQWMRMVAPLEHNEYGNAFVGNVSGETIRIDDVSPIPHTVSIKVNSENPSDVTLTKCSKNLWSFRPSVAQNGVTIVTDENGRIRYSGTCDSSFVIFSTISLPAGTYTLSDRASHIATNSADARTQIYIPELNIDVRLYWDSPVNGSKTFTLDKPCSDVRLRIKGAVGVNFDGYSIMPMLEVGSKATEYEPHKSETYTPDADGTVDILSTAPTMTLYTDTEGVIVEATYNRDSNKVLDYIDKNVITASATLKDNGAYTLIFEKGVKL